MPSSAHASQPHATARSPFAGCAILIAAALVMLFLIVFSTYTLFRQFNEIAKFTAEKPAALETTPLGGRDAELNDLAERIEGFRQKLGGKTEASLALTPEEINLAIAAYDAFKDLRGTFRVLQIKNGRMRIAISFPLNGKPRLARQDESGWITSDPRFLNATMVCHPAFLKREIVLRIDELEVPDAKVPREFTEQMSPYRITERYVADPVLGPAMAALTEVALEDGRMVLRHIPGKSPAGDISRDEVDSARNRFFTILAIACCVFLIFAGTVVFLGLRAKSRDL